MLNRITLDHALFFVQIILTQSWKWDWKWDMKITESDWASWKYFIEIILWKIAFIQWYCIIQKKKKWGEMEEYLSVFSNKTLHFIQEEKIWKLGNFCYSFSGYWVKQNSKEKLVLLWGSLTWFSFGPCSLVSWASAELIHAVSQKHL